MTIGKMGITAFDPHALADRFERTWGGRPTHVVRAPGRVNLIGEHIDYCGLSVLPMAIDRAVWLAFRPSGSDEVRVATNAPGFETRSFSVAARIKPGPPGDWANYVKAAVQAIAATRPGAGRERHAAPHALGFEALIDGDLPIAGGLSSSSALVVAAALAALHVAGSDDPALVPSGWGSVTSVAPRLRLGELLAEGERYVGTAGGGMDQAACLLGESGAALRVDFDPLTVHRIGIPDGWRFVIAHSGERAEKSGAAQRIYNARTAEAREAARIAWTRLGESGPFAGAADGGLRSYRSLLDRGVEIGALGEAVDPRIAARFSHIMSEAVRVDDAAAALEERDLERFGRLLDDSHRSLRDRYEVSTPRLDALVDRATDAGAAGARLTGAGLGGSIVAVCSEERTIDVLHALGDAHPFLAVASDGATLRSIEGR